MVCEIFRPELLTQYDIAVEKKIGLTNSDR